MSEAEYNAGIEAGTFKPLLGDDLYVTNDPDRLAGGAYGAKGGGYIVEIDPSVQTHPTTSRTVAGLDEEAVSSIEAGQITRAWKWDPTAKDHLPVGARGVSAEPTGQTTRITGAPSTAPAMATALT